MTNEEEVRQLKIKVTLDYWSKKRINFTDESNEIMKKIERGEELTELDCFILVCDDSKMIENYRTFYNIRKRLEDKTITNEDIIFLIDTLGINDNELEKILKTSLLEHVNRINNNNQSKNKNQHL